MAFKRAVLRVSELIGDVLTGAVIQTAATGTRVVISPLFGAMVQFFTNAPDEVVSGRIYSGDEVTGARNDLTLHIHSPAANDGFRIAQIILRSYDIPFPTFLTELELNADHVQSSADEFDIAGNLTVQGDVDIPAAGTLHVSGDTILDGNLSVGVGKDLTVGVSQPVVGFDFGIIAPIANAFGQVTINHNLGVTPQFATAIYHPSVTTTQRRIYKMQAATAISITFEIWRDDLNALEANGVQHVMAWFAVA